jgi:hypothetical protein
MNVAHEAVSDADAGRRELTLTQLSRGELADAAKLIEAELASGEAGTAWVTEMIIQAMQADDLCLAGDLARINARLRYGGRLPPAGSVSAGEDPVLAVPEAEPQYRGPCTLSAGKLRHDIDQFRYLREAGIIRATDVDAVIEYYEQAARRLEQSGPEARQPLTPAERARIGEVYGRIVHVRDTPRLDRALSKAWDPVVVEDRYLRHRPGVVVIDDFLVPEALEEMRRFCLESTVWNANRYPNGRLGAFFDSGFNCPILLQVAEELTASFPRIIGQRHRLRQLWGFKYPPRLPADSTIHADFAAVNVNFWITPERANRNPRTGGLIIYDVDAPREWDFVTYNERLDLIKDFLSRRRADIIYVPYRPNRAIIFNSDLFHATAEVDFESAYADRRINITMLYGVRELDDFHPGRSAHWAGQPSAAIASGWRSAAFSRARHRP